MNKLGPVTPDSRAQLLSDGLHAIVVLCVVFCVTGLAVARIGLPQDVIGTVYGGAIGYAAGRAGNIVRTLRPWVHEATTDPAGGQGSET